MMSFSARSLSSSAVVGFFVIGCGLASDDGLDPAEGGDLDPSPRGRLPLPPSAPDLPATAPASAFPRAAMSRVDRGAGLEASTPRGRSEWPDLTPAEVSGPRLEFVAPTDGAQVTNPVNFELQGEGVEQLRLSADGWLIATWRPAVEGWTRSYTFTGVGYERQVVVEGLDASGATALSRAVRLTVVPPASVEEEEAPDWGTQLADDLIANASAYLSEAWANITAGTPCVAFVSVGLRRHPDPARRFPHIYATVTEGPPDEPCAIQGRCVLEQNGFSGPHFDARDLRKGDICFTQDVAPFAGQLWPDHTYVFVAWETPGRTDYAWVIDNRQNFGTPYLRNITASGANFTPFQYFMRSPFQAPP